MNKHFPNENQNYQLMDLEPPSFILNGNGSPAINWLNSLNSQGRNSKVRLSEKAFYGPIGSIVKKIDPQTEAHPAALLVNLLVPYGNILGRSRPHYAGQSKQHTKLFAMLVGRTANGRKGTSWDAVRGIVEALDPDWYLNCREKGISTGEGIIHRIRDRECDGADVIDDGVSDKRLFIVESEFGGVLKRGGREGNTVSQTIRDCWDDEPLSTLTKNKRERATDHHVSIIGHVTKHELDQLMAKGSDHFNGFANRFLWIHTERSGRVPRPNPIRLEDFTAEIKELSLGISMAVKHCDEELNWTQSAQDLWDEEGGLYDELSEEIPGLLGAVQGRALPMVIRIAAIYAMADGSSFIDCQHLEAAKALWDYSSASTRLIFKGLSPMARKIQDRIDGSECSKTELHRKLGGHVDKCDLDDGLRELKEHGKIEIIIDPTAKKPKTIIKPVCEFNEFNEFNPDTPRNA